jgi:hypothetical protein
MFSYIFREFNTSSIKSINKVYCRPKIEVELMSTSAVLVFTARGFDTIIREGGSQAWVLDQVRARQCEYLVCSQNRRTDWGDGRAEHGSAFLIGRIADVVPSTDEGRQQRWLIRISEFAQLNMPKLWEGLRNPVKYTTLEELGIDQSKLAFQPMPETSTPGLCEGPAAYDGGALKLTINDAKRGLAANFGVSPDDIEITIRG